MVVNYIQILYLCILKQRIRQWYGGVDSCELHSNLVSLHSETTCFFGEHLLDRCELHSNLVSLHSETTEGYADKLRKGCELHSNLVSLHSETTNTR